MVARSIVLLLETPTEEGAGDGVTRSRRFRTRSTRRAEHRRATSRSTTTSTTQAYVDNANRRSRARLDGPADRGLLANLDIIPEDKRTPRPEQRRRHANHSLFWEIMGRDGGGEPSGALGDAIADTFGGFDELKTQVNDAGVKRFGSVVLARLERNRARGLVDTELGPPVMEATSRSSASTSGSNLP